MIVGPDLRTKDLADAVAISVQQVRNYEAGGFLPPADRSPAGYRRYTRRHLVALQTTRVLIAGFTWQVAQHIMQAVNAGELQRALALMDQRHAELAGMRQQLEQTMAALTVLAAQMPSARHVQRSEPLRVGTAAARVGVRVSALRFWEQQGLVQPGRDKHSRYRVYDEQQLYRLRIVALLRQANYGVEEIRATLNELDAGRPRRALAAVEQRRNDLTALSWRCVAATAALHGYICEFIDARLLVVQNTPSVTPPA